jgi:hypothetical protein
MRRVLLFCLGIALGLAAVVILWNGPDLYLFTDPWHAAEFTRIVGVAVIVEGAILALGAGACFGRALVPLTDAPAQSGSIWAGPVPAFVGGGPVLPICGILFLLAAVGPFGQASRDSEALEVMDSMPGQWGADLVEDFRRHERTERTFGVFWLLLGGALLATPLFLKPRAWQLGWRINGVGCGIGIGGLFLSGTGALACVANGLALEGANKDFSLVGQLGVLSGAIVAVLGSIIAVLGKSEP